MILTALILSAICFGAYKVHPVQVKRLRSRQLARRPYSLARQSVRFLHPDNVLQSEWMPTGIRPHETISRTATSHTYYVPFYSTSKPSRVPVRKDWASISSLVSITLAVNLTSNGFRIFIVSSKISFPVFRAVMKIIAARLISMPLKVSTTTDRRSPGSQFASSEISIK